MTRILIADDNAINIYLLESLLKGHQYTVATARNGADALALAKENPPDLIITDILMPKMDGFELCRQWRADDRLRTVPFIFYTATYTDSRDEKLALSLGADRFLIKPASPELIITTVRELLEESRLKAAGIPSGPQDDRISLLEQYNEVLFRKLEKRIHQYEEEIAERKRVEVEISDKEAFLSTIVENIPDMIFVKNAEDLRFVRFNQAGEDLLGYSREDLLGKNDYDLFPPGQADFFTEKDREVFRTQRIIDIPEEAIMTRDKGLRVIHTKKIPLYDNEGRPKYLLGISEDITERKRAEEAILLTNRKLELMNDVTYQDIHNKLTALTGYIEFDKESLSEDMRRANRSRELDILGSIRRIIRNTKEYQQMGVNQLQWVSLESTIHVQASRQEKIAPVSLLIDLHGLEIYTDPLIGQVMDNLISNALNHGKTLTRISFRCRTVEEGSVVIICEDDGIGIRHAEKTRIFDRIVGGEGKFGLFFVREFLTISHMAITETGEPGKGARFEITVPQGKWRFSA